MHLLAHVTLVSYIAVCNLTPQTRSAPISRSCHTNTKGQAKDLGLAVLPKSQVNF